ncbi:MAG: alpha/beta hydrolase, partial [Actinomycetota bacterium]
MTATDAPTRIHQPGDEIDVPPLHRRSRALRVAWGAAAFAVAAALAGFVYQHAASAVDDSNHPPPGERIEVGDHRLHLLCQGSGSPTVVLESGLGGFSQEWSHLQPDIATTTRVCAYDRAGYGWSDSVDEPKTSVENADDLHTLLANGGETGPFLLVGHSLGGLHVRTFALRYPDDAAGLVLLDSSHEQQTTRLAMLTPLEDAQLDGLSMCRRLAPLGLPRLLDLNDGAVPSTLPISAETRAAWVSRLNQTRFCATVRDEFVAARAETSRATPPPGLGDLPLTVLTSGRDPFAEQEPVDGVTEEDLDDATRIAAELQAELAELSTESTHRVIAGAGHYIHWDQPAEVVDVINDAIIRWRQDDPVEATSDVDIPRPPSLVVGRGLDRVVLPPADDRIVDDVHDLGWLVPMDVVTGSGDDP